MQNDDDRSQLFDGGGRVTLKIPITSGPSWDALWREHVKRNWRNRDEDNFIPSPPSRTVARRLSQTQRQRG